MALITLIRRAGVAGGRRTQARAGRAGHLRRVAVLRRQHDHAGDLGAVGGRGAEGRRSRRWSTWSSRSPRRSSSSLFLVQRLGTAAVGRLFGPVMVVWFVVDRRVRRRAASPTTRRSSRRCRRPTRSDFFVSHFSTAFFALAAVVLAVTGAEALYADMGHFGRAPITRAWLLLVFPACILSYMGQGALILDDPAQHQQPVLPARARLGPAADGLPGHRGDGHRLAGGHHRRVLGRPPGRPARLPAAAAHRAHLGGDDRADLRARGSTGC